MHFENVHLFLVLVFFLVKISLCLFKQDIFGHRNSQWKKQRKQNSASKPRIMGLGSNWVASCRLETSVSMTKVSQKLVKRVPGCSTTVFSSRNKYWKFRKMKRSHHLDMHICKEVLVLTHYDTKNACLNAVANVSK